MNDVIAVQLAISKLHMQSLLQKPATETVAVEALAELNTALAELEATNDELMKQNTSLAALTAAHEIEARRYRDLFERVPVSYIVTDGWGVILDVNAAAAEMLNVPGEMLYGRPISVFVPLSERRAFRERISKLPMTGVWEAVFRPRGRDTITVQIDVANIPTEKSGERKLGWVLQNTTPQRVAASSERMLKREIALRMEAHASIMRLRALNVGLEMMAHDDDLPPRQRVMTLLESLVPHFADTIVCYLPSEIERPVQVGETSYAGHVVQTVVLAPNRDPGRLVARRATPFNSEDAAILQSAANGISLLLFST